MKSNVNFFSSLRWKMILLFIASTILTLISTGLLYALPVLTIAEGIPFLEGIARWIYYYLGEEFATFIVGIVFFILYFSMLSKRTITYLEQISGSIQQIADGQFDHRIPVRSGDELGKLAENINTMTNKLKQSIEEERNAERTKNELITNVSHDLRTPLTSIRGYLDLIESDRYRDEVELRQYTQIAYAKTERLQHLIEDLFEYTRSLYGGMKLNRTHVNIGELLEQLVAEMVPITEQAGVSCRTFPAEEKIFISADGGQLMRVFENLISNAIQYGKEGEVVEIVWRKENSEAVIDVINYGEPIPSSDLPYIFERFYRVDKSRAEQTGGTGLGLAIAKNIVELHGGTITAYSDFEQTVFQTRLHILSNC